jgi:3D (Asp-Asp-Asp) domain-containing protein
VDLPENRGYGEVVTNDRRYFRVKVALLLAVFLLAALLETLLHDPAVPETPYNSDVAYVRLSPPVLRVALTVTATAYSSTVSQTDSTPFVTASGTRARPGVLAVSRDLLRTCCPFGTRVRIAGQEYVVEDTMAHYWRRRVDIWKPSREEAIRWGVRQVQMEALR